MRKNRVLNLLTAHLPADLSELVGQYDLPVVDALRTRPAVPHDWEENYEKQVRMLRRLGEQQRSPFHSLTRFKDAHTDAMNEPAIRLRNLYLDEGGKEHHQVIPCQIAEAPDGPILRKHFRGPHKIQYFGELADVTWSVLLRAKEEWRTNPNRMVCASGLLLRLPTALLEFMDSVSLDLGGERCESLSAKMCGLACAVRGITCTATSAATYRGGDGRGGGGHADSGTNEQMFTTVPLPFSCFWDTMIPLTHHAWSDIRVELLTTSVPRSLLQKNDAFESISCDMDIWHAMAPRGSEPDRRVYWSFPIWTSWRALGGHLPSREHTVGYASLRASLTANIDRGRARFVFINCALHPCPEITIVPRRIFLPPSCFERPGDTTVTWFELRFPTWPTDALRVGLIDENDREIPLEKTELELHMLRPNVLRCGGEMLRHMFYS